MRTIPTAVPISTQSRPSECIERVGEADPDPMLHASKCCCVRLALSMSRLSMEPVHLPEDDEEFHDAPEASHPAHPVHEWRPSREHSTQTTSWTPSTTPLRTRATQTSGADTSHSSAQPTHDTSWGQPLQGNSRDVNQSSVSASSIVEEPFDSDADADGFISGSHHRDSSGGLRMLLTASPLMISSGRTPTSSRRWAAVAEDEAAEAEALTPEETQVTHRLRWGPCLRHAAHCMSRQMAACECDWSRDGRLEAADGKGRPVSLDGQCPSGYPDRGAV